MRFAQNGAGRMTGYPAATFDRVDIQKVGRDWVLTVLEEYTSLPLHVFRAARQYECCQEACRYFGEGAFARQEVGR